MKTVVPQKTVDKIEFYENHITPWTTNAVAIGTTTTAVMALDTKTQAARTAYTAQQAAQSAAKDATEILNQAVAAMQLAGTAIIDQIRSAAKTTGPSVYPLASIPAPATPTPVGEPGKPFDFAVELGVNGALTLSWKSNNPVGCTGVMYQLWRKIGTGDFSYLGGCGTKTFVDNSVPAGSGSLTYQMQAVRSSSIGDWAQFNVNFGVSGGTTVTESTPSKIAA